MAKDKEKRHSAYEPLPRSMIGPVVDTAFWTDHVSPAGQGPVELGVDRAVKQLRSMPPPIIILDL